MKLLSTSADWLSESSYTVLDPDGWDRLNYEYSFNIELIDYQEYQYRLFRSTLEGKHKPDPMSIKQGCPYCDYLDCTDEPPTLLINFKCLLYPQRKIANAGACFVDMDTKRIIANCPGFSKNDAQKHAKSLLQALGVEHYTTRHLMAIMQFINDKDTDLEKLLAQLGKWDEADLEITKNWYTTL